jgi:hypothetical protein
MELYAELDFIRNGAPMKPMKGTLLKGAAS